MAKVDESKELMIIDTDCGIDDALAMMLALSFKDKWQILAITCCHGNTSIDNVCNNVLKVLHLCGETEIPVYKGCDRPLLASSSVPTVHGDDGLGNVAHEFSSGNLSLAEGHAVTALVHLAKQYKHRIHLVAIAPLTNIAMAHRMDPDFTANLKSLTFMGGNICAVGNVTPTAEFNFYCDPESAHIIVTESKCPTTMIPWETTIDNGMEWDFYENISCETERGCFLKKITSFRACACKKRGNLQFLDCDILALCAVINPKCVRNLVSGSVNVDDEHKSQVRIFVPYTPLRKTDSSAHTVNVIQEFNKGILRSLRENVIYGIR